jgi:DNA-binding response OmpR family regulator
MNVAETWQPPDWFDSPDAAQLAQRHAPGTTGLRIVLVDGTADDERQLLNATRAAGIECACEHWSQGGAGSAALLFEAVVDLAGAARCSSALRQHAQLGHLPALVAVQPEQLSQLDRALGFDDFVLLPCQPLEVRARVRAIARRRIALEAPSEEALDDDGIQVDAVSHEALMEGRIIRMTAREFALFAYLRARPERVLTRQHLLARVWGYRYRGGPRTVDTHIGRLRLKFGAAFPIETVRSNGYRVRLRTPQAVALDPAAQDTSSHAAE